MTVEGVFQAGERCRVWSREFWADGLVAYPVFSVCTGQHVRSVLRGGYMRSSAMAEGPCAPEPPCLICRHSSWHDPSVARLKRSSKAQRVYSPAGLLEKMNWGALMRFDAVGATPRRRRSDRTQLWQKCLAFSGLSSRPMIAAAALSHPQG